MHQFPVQLKAVEEKIKQKEPGQKKSRSPVGAGLLLSYC